VWSDLHNVRCRSNAKQKIYCKSVRNETDRSVLSGYCGTRTGFFRTASIILEVRYQGIADVLAPGSKEIQTCLGCSLRF
jgi:hypothetical protein